MFHRFIFVFVCATVQVDFNANVSQWNYLWNLIMNSQSSGNIVYIHKNMAHCTNIIIIITVPQFNWEHKSAKYAYFSYAPTCPPPKRCAWYWNAHKYHQPPSHSRTPVYVILAYWFDDRTIWHVNGHLLLVLRAHHVCGFNVYSGIRQWPGSQCGHLISAYLLITANWFKCWKWKKNKNK